MLFVPAIKTQPFVRKIVGTLSDAAHSAFESLVANISPMSVFTAGRYLSPTMQRECRSYYAERPEYEAAHELYDLGLIRLDTFEQTVWSGARWCRRFARHSLRSRPLLLAATRPETISAPAQNRLAYPVLTSVCLTRGVRNRPMRSATALAPSARLLLQSALSFTRECVAAAKSARRSFRGWDCGQVTSPISPEGSTTALPAMRLQMFRTGLSERANSPLRQI
jgi:hypothetical protein